MRVSGAGGSMKSKCTYRCCQLDRANEHLHRVSLDRRCLASSVAVQRNQDWSAESQGMSVLVIPFGKLFQYKAGNIFQAECVLPDRSVDAMKLQHGSRSVDRYSRIKARKYIVGNDYKQNKSKGLKVWSCVWELHKHVTTSRDGRHQ